MQEISLAYAAIKWNGGAIEKRCMVSVGAPYVQGRAKRPRFVNFIPDVAYHFCLNFPETVL